jgi:hypothetical protein
MPFMEKRENVPLDMYLATWYRQITETRGGKVAYVKSIFDVIITARKTTRRARLFDGSQEKIVAKRFHRSKQISSVDSG